MRVAVLLTIIAMASATPALVEITNVFHSDSWCRDHHLAEGSAACVQNDGCCYSADVKSCHSCEAHENWWCEKYGQATDDLEAVQACISHAGCTFDAETSTCITAEERSSPIITCTDAQANAMQDDVLTAFLECEGEIAIHSETNSATNQNFDAGVQHGSQQDENSAEATVNECPYWYYPACSVEGDWLAEQSDNGADGEVDVDPEDDVNKDNMHFCVDEDGHEIPDTRKRTGADSLSSVYINCDKERKLFIGDQCPNAVTLTAAGGQTIMNDHEGVGNTDILCNTDKDCKEDEWCCFNGAGYSCEVPIRPLSGCGSFVVENGQEITGVQTSDDGNLEGVHGVEAILKCAAGFDAIPLDGPQEQSLSCKHGKWSEVTIDCKEQCGQYEVQTDAQNEIRSKDYMIRAPVDEDGNKNWCDKHGATRTVECVFGYGPVSGSKDVIFDGKETVECVNGRWETTTKLDENTFLHNDNSQSLVCDSCFDAPEQGFGAFRDEKGNTCKYYESRPLECVESQGAMDACRVSCRTCSAALRKFQQHTWVAQLNDKQKENSDNWTRGQHKIKKSVGKVRSETIQVARVVSN